MFTSRQRAILVSVTISILILGMTALYLGGGVFGQGAAAVEPPSIIGLMPDDCVPGPEPMTVAKHVAPVVGSYPVWAAMPGPTAQIVYGEDSPTTEYGWSAKFLLIMRNTYEGDVTIRAKNLETDEPVYFQLNAQETPTESLRLEIDQNGAFTFADFPGAILIPSAGCYSLEAEWDGGYWRINFSAGRVPEA